MSAERTPLPATLWSLLGPISVEESAKGLKGAELGSFSYDTRVIRVRPKIHEQARRHTLEHEWIHSILWDAGVSTLLKTPVEEAICDALATALILSGRISPSLNINSSQ